MKSTTQHLWILPFLAFLLLDSSLHSCDLKRWVETSFNWMRMWFFQQLKITQQICKQQSFDFNMKKKQESETSGNNTWSSASQWVLFVTKGSVVTSLGHMVAIPTSYSNKRTLWVSAAINFSTIHRFPLNIHLLIMATTSLRWLSTKTKSVAMSSTMWTSFRVLWNMRRSDWSRNCFDKKWSKNGEYVFSSYLFFILMCFLTFSHKH